MQAQKVKLVQMKNARQLEIRIEYMFFSGIDHYTKHTESYSFYLGYF